MASTAKFDTWQDSSGKPLYGVRAWVNFNGTGTVAIRASGNVSSVSDLGVGVYGVNFSNSLSDANYAVGGTSEYSSGYDTWLQAPTKTTTQSVIAVVRQGALVDSAYVGVIVVR